ncbi:MAG: [FeFe] hydrogenase H-cluster maturation GTPase HydF [Proteobacteria bacterium]|nr:[FeFe] hydrogenase H-cluster maturation GTPase HydF [Pseudomonadota bacterium]
MQNTPKGLRLHIGIFGRRNVGKSSILNALTHQTVSIVSDQKGTTTDPVEKPMELLPLGPVLFIDTAGLDDEGLLGDLRIERTRAVFGRCDLALLVTDGTWSEHEASIQSELSERQIPWIAVLNHADKTDYSRLMQELSEQKVECVQTSAPSGSGIEDLLQAIIRIAPADFLDSRQLIGDIIKPNDHVLLVIPIDKEAPKGRLIMPRVQTIRDILDTHAVCSICKEDQVSAMLGRFKEPPVLVVTDSQAFGTVSPQVPASIHLTGFSVLFARFKGDLTTMARGAAMIGRLQPGDRILIAEACTHHPIQDDIGRVKIPGWLRKTVGDLVQIDVISGAAFPDDLTPYRLIIHCGACMWTRRQMLSRVRQAAAQGVAITNYGLAIAAMHGILDRALEPFPEALEAWNDSVGAVSRI